MQRMVSEKLVTLRCSAPAGDFKAVWASAALGGNGAQAVITSVANRTKRDWGMVVVYCSAAVVAGLDDVAGDDDRGFAAGRRANLFVVLKHIADGNGAAVTQSLGPRSG